MRAGRGCRRDIIVTVMTLSERYFIVNVIPNAIMNDKELVAKLPLVFRTIQGKKLTDRQLRNLAEVIRKA